MTPDAVSLAAIQRILVAVDGSEHSLAALDAAAALAAQLHAELEALFVEDVDLLRLADLPCARVMSLVLLEAEHIDRERMERQLRLQAARARETLERRATALGVRASFRAVRGEVIAEVLAAAAEVDLLGLGRAGHGRLGPPRGGTTLRAALAAGRPVLVAGRAMGAGEGLLAVYEGSPASIRALRLAEVLAANAGQVLQVLIAADSPAETQRLAAEVHGHLGAHARDVELSYSWAEPTRAVLAAVRRLRPALLIVGGELADQVLETADRPVLVVP